MSTTVLPPSTRRLTAPTFDVEGEAARGIATHARLGDAGEQLTDGSERAGVGGRVAPWGSPDGRLVDVDHLVDVLHPHDGVAGPRLVLGFVEELGQLLVQNQGQAWGLR